ncbi:uncharacterized protein PFL1_05859 [Pseudozyma flocculosa PF-1]|uniref:Uncharacterized protein n=2 Tax=Pseudozyma flocculosa TaxID=84751 RepID=A0A5C3F2E3_9BASI|nr:uncharacterized protein PFL1_05859 [Pseudozyma flocculosa PF-1]EPQ26537.1 hypothetical protein PFL1_05859 [Pseudozyma flocculosa PF-1]SPO38472.1 uncharacterized protein PSFLO_03950 [Pseudozyma flocculosa]
MASTSAPLPRAVVLKGPSTNSKSYFVALPDTLDELIEKAKSLFSLPPDKTPVITLGTDERAILLQETMPFVRDREALVFRWVAATPKRQLGNRVRWDEPSSVQFNANAPSSSIGTPARPLLAHVGRTASLDLYSPASKSIFSTRSPMPAPSKSSASHAHRDPSIHFGDGLTARQAHAKRVLQEQKDKEARRQRRLEEARSGMVQAADATEDVPPSNEESAMEQAEQHDCLQEITPTEARPTPTATAETTITADDNASGLDTLFESSATHPGTGESLLISPPRKRHPDNLPLDTPPSSGSRSSSPYRSSERKRASEMLRSHQHQHQHQHQHPGGSDEQASSPIQSPTRDLSAARQKAAFSISDITNALTAGSELKRVTEEDLALAEKPRATVTEAIKPAAVEAHVRSAEIDDDQIGPVLDQSDAIEDVQMDALETPSDEPEAEASPAVESSEQPEPASASAPEPAPEPAPVAAVVPDAEVEKTYRYIDNLVLQLLSHGSNTAFREPLTMAAMHGPHANLRQVDLFTIREAIQTKAYGSAHLTDSVKASKAVVLDFETDLAAMYGNARKQHGSKSAQAQCADTLERFSASFLEEWKRSIDKRSGRDEHAGGETQSKEQQRDDIKTAVMRQLTPTKRGEKRPVQIGGFPFAFNGASRMPFPGSDAPAALGRPGGAASRKLSSLQVQQPGQIKRTSSLDGLTGALQPSSSTATKKSRFSYVADADKTAVSDGPFRDTFAQARVKASAGGSREADPLTAFERALRGPAPAVTSTPVKAAVVTEQPNTGEQPDQPDQPDQQRSDSVVAATESSAEPEEPAPAAEHVAEQDAMLTPCSADRITQSEQAEPQEASEASAAPSEQAESTAMTATAEQATDLAAAAATDAAPAQSSPESESSTADDSAGTTAAADGSRHVEEHTDAVNAHNENPTEAEVSAGATTPATTTTENEAGSEPCTPSSLRASRRGKRARASHGEMAARLASEALAELEEASTPNSSQGQSQSQSQSRSSKRLQSTSPAKAASSAPSPSTAASEYANPVTETRQSKRRRATSTTTSAIATPPQPRTVRQGSRRSTATSTPTHASSTTSRHGHTKEVSPFSISSDDSDSDSDDDKPLRARPRSASAGKTAKADDRDDNEDVDEEDEVERMFSSSPPSSQSTSASSSGSAWTARAAGKKGAASRAVARKRKANDEGPASIEVHVEVPRAGPVTRQTRSTRRRAAKA